MKTDLYLSQCTKLKSKWIKDLNIRPDIPNLIEQKVGNSLELTDTGVPEQNTKGSGSKINN